jgi:hypothetical protein
MTPVALHQGIDGSDPIRPDSEGRVVHEERRIVHSSIVAVGTLACPSCDAPVALGDMRVAPPDPLGCPFCDHRAAAREFLSLGGPLRPARVAVRLILQEPSVSPA